MLPGFGLSLGYTIAYLSLVVLIPLAGLAVRSATLGWDEFWKIAFDPRVQRVEETVRLAQPQRRTEPERPVDARQQRVDGRIQRIEANRGRAWGHGRSLARLA